MQENNIIKTQISKAFENAKIELKVEDVNTLSNEKLLELIEQSIFNSINCCKCSEKHIVNTLNNYIKKSTRTY